MTLPRVARFATRIPDTSPLAGFAAASLGLLADADPVVHEALCAEHAAQAASLDLSPTAMVVHPSVLSCLGTSAVNAHASDGPGARLGSLARERAAAVFGGRAMGFSAHEPAAAVRLFSEAWAPGGRTVTVADADWPLDENVLAKRFQEGRPDVVVCRAPAFGSRPGDHALIRALADEVDALLITDLTEVAALTAAGLHPEPLAQTHLAVSCPRRQLAGPRGSLVLYEEDARLPRGHEGFLRALVQRALEDSAHTPDLGAWAALAHALALADTDSHRAGVARAVANASALAEALADSGLPVVPRRTDTHLVVLALTDPLPGPEAARRALAEIGVRVGPPRPPGGDVPEPGRLSLGTGALSRRGLAPSDMLQMAHIIAAVLNGGRAAGDGSHEVRASTRERARTLVRQLVSQFPLPDYLAAATGEGAR